MIVAILSFVSCISQSPTKITEKDILKEFNRQLTEQADNEQYIEFPVGTVNLTLKGCELALKMEAAGLLSCSINRYPWWEKRIETTTKEVKVRKYDYWYGYYDATEYKTVKTPKYTFVDNYVADIRLTSKGKKIIVNPLSIISNDLDPDLYYEEENADQYAWNTVDVKNKWPYIENPFIEKKPAVSEKSSSNKSNVNSVNPYTNTNSETEKVERRDSSVYKEFCKVDFDSDTKHFLSHRYKGIKARNIQISNSSGIPVATAEVIFVVTDVTDAGRIFNGISEGERHLTDVSLTYYYDKGWVIDDEIDIK